MPPAPTLQQDPAQVESKQVDAEVPAASSDDSEEEKLRHNSSGASSGNSEDEDKDSSSSSLTNANHRAMVRQYKQQ
jgi:hypothetical protein